MAFYGWAHLKADWLADSSPHLALSESGKSCLVLFLAEELQGVPQI